MIPRFHSAAIEGINGLQVMVEADAFPIEEGGRISIVGLPDTAVKESVQRVSSAIDNSGFVRPDKLVVTVNLAPADVKKQGPGFDLPIALAVEMATQLNHTKIPPSLRLSIPSEMEDWCIVGELALDGRVRPVRGALAIALAAQAAGMKKLMLPAENAEEAAVVEGLDIYPVTSLVEAWQTLAGHGEDKKLRFIPSPPQVEYSVDFDEIKGQSHARRAMEIAAAGGHNILMSGSPGSGKSMLATRLPSILPPMTRDEALEASRIHSICGLLPHGLLTERPFRSPHHTISDIGLMGGGSTIRPGEVTLAHHGVLFMDELPEFQRRALETLRQPLESGQITISRASGTALYPCGFMLVAAMNPCPCGYLGDHTQTCRCKPAEVARYRKKISGPLLDRFDIIIELPAVPAADLLEKGSGECSADIRERVVAARARQQERYKGLKATCNARLSGKQVQQFCPLTEELKAILLQAIEQFSLSARAFDRILRVSRTIADLAGHEAIEAEDLLEAINLRTAAF